MATDLEKKVQESSLLPGDDAPTLAVGKEEKKKGPGRPGKPDWLKEGYRVLVSPRNHTFQYRFRQKVPTDDGGFATLPADVQIEVRSKAGVTGGDLLGYWEKGKGGPTVKEIDGQEYIRIVDVRVPRYIPLHGGQCHITKALADRCELTFEALVKWIENYWAYGKNFAFMDDRDAMEKLLPYFQGKIEQNAYDEEARQLPPDMIGKISHARLTDTQIAEDGRRE